MKSVFAFNGSYSSFENFARSVPGARLEGNKIRVDSPDIRGTVLRVDIESGLTVIDWDLQLLRDYSFHNNFTSIEDEKVYLLTYYAEPVYEAIEYHDGVHQLYTDKAPALLVMSNTAAVEFRYLMGVHIRCVSISFTHSWLLHQLVDVKEEKVVSSYLLRILQSIQLRPLSRTEIIYSLELSKELRQSSGPLLTKAHIFNLLSFLYRHVALKAHRIQHPSPHTEVMIQVEKDLVSHLSIGPPSLEVLAARYYLSASTLSRHFKNVYGLSIYEYYMHKKMELGRDLLCENKTVSEVGAILGYENVSHFIAMFKKTYGYSPGKQGKDSM